jgi:hypothetical protein
MIRFAPRKTGTYGLLAVAVVGALVAVTVTLLSSPNTSHGGAAGKTYYVSPTGNDRADGESPENAWRSVGRANEAVLKPGDRLLLEGGSDFTETLELRAADAGRPDAPVVVGSYGTGRARITPPGEAGISIVNTAGIEIQDLVLAGDRAAYREKAGITVFADASGAPKFKHVVVRNVEVSGFADGIAVGGAGGAGFRDVRVADSVLHDNMEAGLATYGPSFDAERPSFAHEQVTVSGVEAYRNIGNPANTTRNTGNGIVLGSVDGGVVEHSSAHANGERCAAPEGPIGIWTYDSRRVVIQRNISYHNRTASTADGGGFGLDQNVSSSVLQYNLSYGNDGAGLLAYTGAKNSAMSHNIIRFNISSDDGQRSGRYGGITLNGSVGDINVYQNTVVTFGDARHQPPALVLGSGLSGVTVRNNILRADVAEAVVKASNLSPDQALLQGNDYVNNVAPLAIWWGGRTYTTLSRWRAASGQERVGEVVVGMSVNPWPGAPRIAGMPDSIDVADVAAFMLAPDSPATGMGLDLGRFGIDVGAADFWSHPVAGRRLSVGAYQP